MYLPKVTFGANFNDKINCSFVLRIDLQVYLPKDTFGANFNNAINGSLVLRIDLLSLKLLLGVCHKICSQRLLASSYTTYLSENFRKRFLLIGFSGLHKDN